MLVKVISIPVGEAPERVRREWVGLELLASDEQCDKTEVGIESLEDIPHRYHIHVPSKAAIEVLAKKSLEAADWFRRLVPPDVDLSFGRDEVEVLV